MNNEEIIKFEASGEAETINPEVDIIAIAEKRSGMLEKLASYAIRRTNQSDWIDTAGKPYLTGSGAEKIARVFGVKIHSVRGTKRMSQDDQGSFYIYEYTGVAELPSKFDSIEAVGTCSSRDKFFSMKGGELKPMSQIDECNIQKAAYTNFIGNAITRLLGIRNMTWEEISGLSGGKISRDRSAKVEYNKGAASGGYVISEAQGKRLYAICKSANVAHEAMKAYLKKKYGIDSSKDIKREWYDDICNTAEKNPAEIVKYLPADVPEIDVEKDDNKSGGQKYDSREGNRG